MPSEGFVVGIWAGDQAEPGEDGEEALDIIAVEHATRVGTVMVGTTERIAYVRTQGVEALPVGLELWVCAPLPKAPPPAWERHNEALSTASRINPHHAAQLLQPRVNRVAVIAVTEATPQVATCRVISGKGAAGNAVWLVRE